MDTTEAEGLMTYDELLALIRSKSDSDEVHALRAVVELHKPYGSADKGFICEFCMDRALPAWVYPCPTIEAIEKELV